MNSYFCLFYPGLFSGEFILEYVGEVLDPEEFEKRAAEYSKDKNQHYYFMSLRADAVIDATRKGTRFFIIIRYYNNNRVNFRQRIKIYKPLLRSKRRNSKMDGQWGVAYRIFQ